MFSAWSASNPNAEKKPGTLSKKQINDVMLEGTPDALQAVRDVMTNDKHPKQIEAAKIWIEHAIGRPMQAVELSGKDGGPIESQIAVTDPVEAARIYQKMVNGT